MKRLMTLLAVMLIFSSSQALAASQQIVNLSAQIGEVLSLDISIFELDPVSENPTGGNLAPNMNFGQLSGAPGDALGGQKAFAVILGTNTSSRAYKINATMAAPNNGSVNLPNATLMNVARAVTGAQGNEVDIAGDTFSTANRSAVMTNQSVYTSNGAGTSATVQLTYGISGGNADQSAPFPGWEPIPPGQQAGNYTTTVTYDLVLL
jgi:hypothetical protein